MFRLNRVKAENEALKKELSDLKNKYQTDIQKLEDLLQKAKQQVISIRLWA